jgi:D-alanyl-D-alanine carboxypeptidase
MMKKQIFFFMICSIFCFVCFACTKQSSPEESFSGIIENPQIHDNQNDEDNSSGKMVFSVHLQRVLSSAGLPETMITSIVENAGANPSFMMDLLTLLNDDPYLYLLVDKQHPLPADYAPNDLIQLSEIKNDVSYLLNRNDLSLRQAASVALEEMAAAAKMDGITLLASSSYRSYSYQEQVYARNVAELGEAEANRVSAKPGESQHQLGLIVDFGSITNDFAESKAGLWIAENASAYGWSLSFPKGYEEITGYDWESWHFRYVGKNLAYFIDAYFDGIQQYALQFIDAWLKQQNK